MLFVYFDVTLMARGLDPTVIHLLNYRASFFAKVRTFCVFAFSYAISELSEAARKLVVGKKVESRKVEHREAGGIRKPEHAAAYVYRIEFNVACGVTTALSLSADASGREG